MRLTRLFIPTLVLAARAAAGQLTQPDADAALDPRFQEDQRLEADTSLGRFSIGVSGLSESERRQAQTGDVEFGYLYRYELDANFPRVAELRPFFFNRVESNEQEVYESLGFGAGVRATLRQKYEENNWFVRLSMLTPTDYYRDRYNLDRDQTTIVELFAGFEVPISDAYQDHDIRNRVTPPRLVRVPVPRDLFEPDAASALGPVLLERTHALLVASYLSRVARAEYDDAGLRLLGGESWPVLRLVERVSGERLSDAQWDELERDLFLDDQRPPRRRAIARDLLRRGLTAMMRGPYPLILEPASRPGDAADPSGATRVGTLSRPGMGAPDRAATLDADAMIRDYIAYVTRRIE